MIVTPEDEAERQPSELVTVKYQVPLVSPEIVVVVPLPLVVIAPGLRVNVQVPLEGRPPRITLPVATLQLGCVMVPTTGGEGTGFTVRV